MATSPLPSNATNVKDDPYKPKMFLLRWSFWASVLFYSVIGFFIINLILMVSTVVIDSFGRSWFRTVLPPEWTGQWYIDLANDHNMTLLLGNTFLVAIATTLLALAIAFPAAYVLARKEFPLKGVLFGLFLLPMLIPPLVYGIPIATIFIRLGLGGSLIGIILINLVPITPFCIFVLMPFIEQVDTSLESASRMLGASKFRTFRRVVLPLIIPGLLSAGVLALVKTFAAFELTYLVATTGSSQTMAVALYGDASGAGIRAHQLVNAMAVVYMISTMSLVIVSLIFVKPTQFVVRLKNR
jgi:putative spermidine/putrescine transport system permease protein